jgi:hypothetical protein
MVRGVWTCAALVVLVAIGCDPELEERECLDDDGCIGELICYERLCVDPRTVPGATLKVDAAPESDGGETPAADAAVSAGDASTAADAMAPEADAMAPEADAMAPEADAMAPEVDATAPEADATATEPDAMAPEIDAMAPEPDAIAPDAN